MRMNLLPNISGSRIGFYVPCMGLGGNGDLASAMKLSRLLSQHGAEITVYTDAKEFEVLAPLLETDGRSGVHNIYVDGARGPIACTSLVVDGVEWVAASRQVRRSSFGLHNTDLLVCVHDVPGRADLVSCPRLLVYEYGDHDRRWGHIFNPNHTLDYRTGLIVEKRHPGDVAGGVYLARDPAGASEPISAKISCASRNGVVCRIRDMVRSNDMTGAEIRGLDAALSELKDVLVRSAHISVYYVGQENGVGRLCLFLVPCASHRFGRNVRYVHPQEEIGRTCRRARQVWDFNSIVHRRPKGECFFQREYRAWRTENLPRLP